MEKARQVLLGLLVVSAAVMAATEKPDKGVMTLFQEAQYQEQTAGDLDKAIELYQKVVTDAAEIEKLAARATFQLGMCYLKKDDKPKAAEYFRKIINDYPAQKELIEKASKQLKKIQPSSSQPARDYVIHYKAVDQSQDALELLNKIHPKGVKTFRANRYHADGETIDSICTDTEEGKNKLVETINGSDTLKLVKVESPQQMAEVYKPDKPLRLESVPWVDGEVMELRLKRPAGNEYGAIIYSAQSNVLDGKDIWQIVSHMFVKEGNVSQFTLVKAQADSFVPVYGQTTNWMGNFAAEYGQGNVKLTTNGNTRDIPVGNAVYDNEQALYLIRRMPLAQNYEGCFPIFPVQGGGVTVECRIKVLGVEDITVAAGTFKCFKTDLSIYAGQIKSLQHTLWFSADEHKYLVKYDVGGAGVMELESVRQKAKDAPMIFENAAPSFSVAVPSDWRFYSYQSPGPQYSLQILPPDIKAWAVLVWQKRGDDPDSASAATISKTDSEKMKGKFKNYLIRPDTNKEVVINGCQAAQYIADYQEDGSGLQKYDKPKEMVESRTYIVDKAEVYWFVFRIEKEKFDEQKPVFDAIVKSFEKKK